MPAWGVPIVLCFVFYFKIKSERKDTASRRDTDSLEIHDSLQKHTWEISRLKDDMALHNTLMEDIRTTVDALNVSTAKLSVTVDNLNNVIREMKK